MQFTTLDSPGGRAGEPGVVVDRHWVSHDADDDNLWFVRREADDRRSAVQFECDASGLPILIESNTDRTVVSSVAKACAAIQRFLRDPTG